TSAMTAAMNAAITGARAMLLCCSAGIATAQQQPKATDAGALVRRLADDPNSAAALLRLGPAAATAIPPFPANTGLWGERRQPAMTRALQLLGDLGPDGAGAVDALIDCLEDAAWRPQRGAVLGAIAAIGPWLERRAEISQTLGNRCDKGGYFGEEGFFPCISRLSFDAHGDRSALLAGLEHNNAYVRELAAEALARDLGRERPTGKAATDLAAALRS